MSIQGIHPIETFHTEDIIVQWWKGKPARQGRHKPGLPLPPQQGSRLNRCLLSVYLNLAVGGISLSHAEQRRTLLRLPGKSAARVNLCAWPWEPQTRQLASLLSSLWILHIYVSAVTLLVRSCCQVFLLPSISPRVSSPSAPKCKQKTDKLNPGRRFWREAGHLPTSLTLRAMTGSRAMINTAKKK